MHRPADAPGRVVPSLQIRSLALQGIGPALTCVVHDHQMERRLAPLWFPPITLQTMLKGRCAKLIALATAPIPALVPLWSEAQAAGELTTKAQALEWVRLQAQSI